MKKKKKLSLKELEIKSFITGDHIMGGGPVGDAPKFTERGGGCDTLFVECYTEGKKACQTWMKACTTN